MNDRFKFRVIRGENPFTPTGTVLYFALGDEAGFGQGDIIEQCTGLKDKNGKLIYEGDIVKCDRDFDPDGRVNLTKEVIFTDGTFILANLDPKNRDFCYINRFHNIEIIGNIHEQPEQKD